MGDRLKQLEQLLADVGAMRREQRAFFAADAGSPERRRSLQASKALEKKVDELIAQIGSGSSKPGGQGALFR